MQARRQALCDIRVQTVAVMCNVVHKLLYTLLCNHLETYVQLRQATVNWSGHQRYDDM